MGLIIFLCIGALAGWIAGRLMKGSGFGLLGNMAVGIIGAVIGGWTFSQLGISVAKRLHRLVGHLCGRSFNPAFFCRTV